MTVCTGSLWAVGVRVHVVTRNDVNPHIGASNVSCRTPSCRRNGRFATAVVEQVEICIAEMTISYAIDEIMETRLG